VSMRATQDSIRALMLIRAYRVMGHLRDSIRWYLRAQRAQELRAETYGFTEADLDGPCFSTVIWAWSLRPSGSALDPAAHVLPQDRFQFMHITNPAQKQWLQQR